MDVAVSALILDLEKKNLLDKTLIMITTEFGRPAGFDGGGGRGHQGKAMTCVLAGGGLNHCGAYGETDELSKTIVKTSLSPRLLCHRLCGNGCGCQKYLYDGDRPCLSLIMATPSINCLLKLPKYISQSGIYGLRFIFSPTIRDRCFCQK